ncbi:hypothetical protein MycrhDRAFT_2220 [Mycolicibacterium rhodesiae JS60]|nr:hypothetical protein MycrhDRAFT_2220 [Mycolicibacterium rhodesiae JS60]
MAWISLQLSMRIEEQTLADEGTLVQHIEQGQGWRYDPSFAEFANFCDRRPEKG